jgi:16S rRNA (cytosine967-C5)-methyltransferase
VRVQKPREIAARILQQRGEGADYIENLLSDGLSSLAPVDRAPRQEPVSGTGVSPVSRGLSPVDRALCQEIVYGVVRWQRTLDWLIDRKTNSRAQKAGLQVLLRLGLYQMFWLDRVPDHAAVHETVELAKQRGFGSQAGFLNALLRAYARERDETIRALAALKASAPGLGYSHPDWLCERWQKRWGADAMRQLLDWNNTAPKTFARVNTLRTGAGKLLEQWRSENVEYDFVRRDWLEENLVFELKSHPSLAALPSFQQGLFYVQDPGALMAPRALDPQPGESILDLCSAPGGKTTYIAQLMQDRGRLVAGDSSDLRLQLLRENCARLGVAVVETGVRLESGAKFDRVLVDAPCSNTGVMRRRVDLRWRIRPEEIPRLCGLQGKLLDEASAQTRPGGVLVYSTCSLEPEENSEVARGFLAKHPDFTLEHERELLPFADGVDGAYVARFSKQAGES